MSPPKERQLGLKSAHAKEETSMNVTTNGRKPNGRINWYTRNLPRKIYDYATEAAKADFTLITVNSQLLNMLELGYRRRLAHDKRGGIVRRKKAKAESGNRATAGG
jgi:hypothetical protein